MKKLGFLCTCLGIILILVACRQASNSTSTEESTKKVKGQSAVIDEQSSPNVLQIAAGSEDHSTLVAAVQAAGLEDVLSNAGPLTVFAPNNAAFDALPAGTLEELLKPANKEKLAGIIKYHASPGNYQEERLKDGMNLFQATGHYIKVSKSGDELNVGGANILATIPASNGVVHVVDKVLLPPE